MRLVLLAFLIAPVLNAQTDDLINADRPGIPDGSATLRRNLFQIETGYERDHANGQSTFLTPILLRYGVTDSFELRAEGNGYTSDGWAAASLGLKYHFLDRPSLGVIARHFFRDKTSDVRLAADLDIGERWALNPNVGVVHDKSSTVGTAALTLQYNISKAANVFIDGGLQSSSLLLDLGGAWILRRDTQLDFSIGWGAHGSDVPNVFWSAGISRRF